MVFSDMSLPITAFNVCSRQETTAVATTAVNCNTRRQQTYAFIKELKPALLS